MAGNPQRLLDFAPSLSLLQNPNPIPRFSNNLSCFSCEASLMAPLKVVAEYAKSSRSSCKKCSKPISAKSLRLGLVSKHPRGFDTPSWHHLDCFPGDSDSASSVEAIKGFSALENREQEAIKKMVGRCDKPTKDDDGLHGSTKIYAFDFDGCLARTSV